MITVYINEVAIQLVDQQEALQTNGDQKRLVAHYLGKPKALLQYIDLAEKSTRFEKIIIIGPDLKRLRADFFGFYKLVEAAGGVVFNPKGELLVIYRRGKWDLPKGKIDDGETSEVAAIREVREETGLQNVELGQPLMNTFHTYRNRQNKRCLKLVYWYRMTTTDTELTLQAEEDIEDGQWITKSAFLEGDYDIYRNIRDLISTVKV